MSELLKGLESQGIYPSGTEDDNDDKATEPIARELSKVFIMSLYLSHSIIISL